MTHQEFISLYQSNPKPISNEEKAKQIFDGMQIKPPYHEYQFVGAIEYTIKLTKQQLIDKLEDWLANNICNAYNFRGDNISATFMNDCIKAMKGE